MARVALLSLVFGWLALIGSWLVGPSVALAAPPPRADVELFTREGCPRCVEAKAFVEELRRERPALSIRQDDVVRDREARARLEAIAAEAGQGAVSVPSFYVRGALVVGYAGRSITGRRIEALLDGSNPGAGAEGEGAGTCSAEPAQACSSGESERPDAIDVPLFGHLSARSLGLPLFTVAIGLVDGFNPCAMWVLLFLLSFLVTLHDRKKMALIAGVFVTVSGLAYLAFMAAWLNVFLLVGFSRPAQIVLGLVALLVGSVHVKDFFAFKRGLSFSIPERVKPSLYARMRSVVRAESLWAALLSASALAVLVNVVELLCTAGLPALYTEVLVAQGLPGWKHYAYLGLYNLAYMADDIAMVVVAVVTLSRKKLDERGGRALKLVSGAVMLLLALLLLLKPEWLVL